MIIFVFFIFSIFITYLEVQQDDSVLRLGRLEVLHILTTWWHPLWLWFLFALFFGKEKLKPFFWGGELVEGIFLTALCWNLVGERQLWSQTTRQGGAFSRPQETWRQKDMIYYTRHLFIKRPWSVYCTINFVADPMNYEDLKYLVAPLTLTSYASFVVRLFMYICKKEGCGYNPVGL